jgi:cytochrome P450
MQLMSSLLRESLRERFPLGAHVTEAELEHDPYPFFARIREREPITWVEALGMWYVTGYEDVRAILKDDRRFTTSWEHSTIYDTFGAQMLTTDGARHDRFRRALLHGFSPASVSRLEPAVRNASEYLVTEFSRSGTVALRAAFASRLPIQTMLLTFGLPRTAEPDMRRWYDSFERGLANFRRDPAVRAEAQRHVAELHAFLHESIDRARRRDDGTLLAALLRAPEDRRLTDEELIRNLSIIFFGGISTVEALILNSLWALHTHPAVFQRVRAQPALLPSVIEETMRWMSPVQSATRHVVEDTELLGVAVRAGDTVNCMLGAANRDPRVFPLPDVFDIERPNAGAHLGFATGPHLCIGFRLAKMQVRIALEVLLRRFADFSLSTSPPTGYEFRQPRSMLMSWR